MANWGKTQVTIALVSKGKIGGPNVVVSRGLPIKRKIRIKTRAAGWDLFHQEHLRKELLKLQALEIGEIVCVCLCVSVRSVGPFSNLWLHLSEFCYVCKYYQSVPVFSW